MTSARIDSTNPWYSLWTVVTDFFMIVLDSNIVAIARFAYHGRLACRV